MRICINGGGIGGLAAALTLHSKQSLPILHIDIVEPSMDGFAGRGADINLKPHAVWVLNEIGFMEEVVANEWVTTNQQYYTHDGRLIAELPRRLTPGEAGFPRISIK